MIYTHSVGYLDGKAMIDTNNQAVGYFPSDTAEIGVYPPPVPEQPIVIMEPGDDSEKNS